jgi:hypothetical protein
MQKPISNFRLSDEARRLLRELAAALGISLTAVVELALRRLAKRERVK